MTITQSEHQLDAFIDPYAELVRAMKTADTNLQHNALVLLCVGSIQC